MLSHTQPRNEIRFTRWLVGRWVGGVVRNSNGHEHWPAKLFWHLSILLAASCEMSTFFLIIVLQILWVISLAANASTFVIGTYPIVIFQCNAPFPPVWEATFFVLYARRTILFKCKCKLACVMIYLEMVDWKFNLKINPCASFGQNFCVE